VIPLKDNVPTRNFPLVTVGLIAANVVVWIWEVRNGVNKEVLHYGYYPCTLAGPCDPRFVPPDHLSWYDGVLTSMFLHASWFHIGGNMLFLWIFGNNVEDSMGRVRFFFWYLAAGLAASFTQTFVTLQFADPSARASRTSARAALSPACSVPISCFCPTPASPRSSSSSSSSSGRTSRRTCFSAFGSSFSFGKAASRSFIPKRAAESLSSPISAASRSERSQYDSWRRDSRYDP